MPRKITIAIDGYSSTGKSTLAKQLAKKLGYTYVDSGAMYRAVTFFALEEGFFSKTVNKEALIKALPKIELHFEENEEGNSLIFLNGEAIESQIRELRVANKVSEIAAISEVRKKLVAAQQIMGANGGVVMDGRDIGTVVFPDAELKIFMTAQKAVRAQRRYNELLAKVTDAATTTLREVEANLEQRDMMDSNRSDSPLVQADDAVLLDNSEISPEEQLALTYAWALDKIGD